MHHEREIDALLSPNEAGSIFDRLMAMPRTDEADTQASQWERAVANRFQTHLVKQMRAAIDNGGSRQSAA